MLNIISTKIIIGAPCNAMPWLGALCKFPAAGGMARLGQLPLTPSPQDQLPGPRWSLLWNPRVLAVRASFSHRDSPGSARQGVGRPSPCGPGDLWITYTPWVPWFLLAVPASRGGGLSEEVVGSRTDIGGAEKGPHAEQTWRQAQVPAIRVFSALRTGTSGKRPREIVH